MNINATLLGQMITFAIFIWFTMKYIWPPMMQAMRERQKKIADGLQAAERGKRELDLAERKSKKTIAEAKLAASHIIERANERAVQVIEEAKENARQESCRLLARADKTVQQQMAQARDTLRQDVADLVMRGVEKVLHREIDATAHQTILDALAREL